VEAKTWSRVPLGHNWSCTDAIIVPRGIVTNSYWLGQIRLRVDFVGQIVGVEKSFIGRLSNINHQGSLPIYAGLRATHSGCRWFLLCNRFLPCASCDLQVTAKQLADSAENAHQARVEMSDYVTRPRRVLFISRML
jgi:hypothetical protein